MRIIDTKHMEPMTLHEGELVRLVIDDVDALYRVASEPVEGREGAWHFTLEPMETGETD